MSLTLGVNILASTTEIQLMLSSQLTDGAPVCSAKVYMYLRIALVFLKSLNMNIIYTPLDSEYTAG